MSYRRKFLRTLWFVVVVGIMAALQITGLGANNEPFGWTFISLTAAVVGIEALYDWFRWRSEVST